MSIELRKRDGKNEEGWGYPVGAGVVGMKGGDACVAPPGGELRMRDQGEGDASVPTHRIRHPRPYGYEAPSEVASPKTYL